MARCYWKHCVWNNVTLCFHYHWYACIVFAHVVTILIRLISILKASNHIQEINCKKFWLSIINISDNSNFNAMQIHQYVKVCDWMLMFADVANFCIFHLVLRLFENSIYIIAVMTFSSLWLSLQNFAINKSS